MNVKGCHTCRYDRGGYCEAPDGGIGCNWVGEMFRGEPNSWGSWELKPRLLLRQTLRAATIQQLQAIVDDLKKANRELSQPPVGITDASR
jgi:hypothetical protein